MRPAIASSIALALCTTALPALAEEVNIYSHRQPELIQPLVDAFSAETGIDVNVAFVDKGMAERLVAEGDRSPADLVLTVDIARLMQVVDAGVTQPVESEVLDANIPESFRDPEGHWFGLTSRARIVYASKERVADGEVTTYEDLASEKWKGRICTRSFTNDYNVALTGAVLAHHGAEAARSWLEGVKANLAKKPEGGDRDQVKSIWAGECDISLGNTYYMGQMANDPEQKEWADSVRITFPTFEGGGTHMNISGVAMTRAAPNREAALKLMEWLTSDEAQRIYAETNHEFPVKEGVARSELVQSWGEFTPDEIGLAEVAAQRAEALKLIESVNFDG
ncbi:Fe(3+) ABC transporter substrate-binding protein [Cereibacter azotoformans]|uniref:Iron(III) transport system substrate-binding protein n=2 Tax=Cereibacter TaxID=1653176 RepID=A0A2T5K9C0_9RHOB|nr:Fe(3+) ABC transporter substrate-binding protein [Cereibacter azotoformans]AXQ93259.1 iron ABC transporter substrate-binding protein [Cereibacter sphaeroides]MBO4169081.1 Fe(3+) ABC transporter substrate-binding protein [Cereibacter azotoformans]PTR19016.1 iron(III) transport system substrate-binding protein [Cereibacter azotoformans]UIJ31574.1 Fe(3+) ABC transporter substrate-binding protein [Cereibacter azotoformans]ULB09359.1 Fe(3+) ABC transporter substrate-binding protein [Cereibacter 